jgi:pimeloyl-ACP methyl ester carboxylesterase
MILPLAECAEDRRLKRLALLFVVGLIGFRGFAGEVAPASAIVGGLRRTASLGAALNSDEGNVVIDAVASGSSAEAMGVQPRDIVVSADGTVVTEPAALVAAVAGKRAGDPLTLVVRRDGQTLTRSGKLLPKPLERQEAYDVEYGSIVVGASRRRVIVTKPRGGARHPAVLLIGGIGCYSLDGLLRPAELREPYAKILDGLTRAGHVTMRVEKSGMGDSEGPPCADPRADFNNEAAAFEAGLTQLESYDFVDARKLFIFAHSIGPLVAARIASGHPVHGIIVAETIGTSWLEYDLANVRRQLLLRGVAYDEVDRRVRHHEICAHRYYIEKQTPEQIVASDQACADDLQAPAPYTYMQQLGSLDLAPLWKRIDAPVLIFYGTADFVTDDGQHQYLRDMINSFHKGRAKYVTIAGMDHGLVLAGSQHASYEGKSRPDFAKPLLDETLQFLHQFAVE